eukprot:758707-Hanusia_phi.AAC.4
MAPGEEGPHLQQRSRSQLRLVTCLASSQVADPPTLSQIPLIVSAPSPPLSLAVTLLLPTPPRVIEYHHGLTSLPSPHATDIPLPRCSYRSNELQQRCWRGSDKQGETGKFFFTSFQLHMNSQRWNQRKVRRM